MTKAQNKEKADLYATINGLRALLQDAEPHITDMAVRMRVVQALEGTK